MIEDKKKKRYSILELHDFVCEGCYWIGGGLLALTALFTNYDIFLRYFYLQPTSWAVDYVEYALVYSTLLAAAWLSRTDGHVKLTFLYDRFSHKGKLILDILNSTIGAVATAIIIWYGGAETISAYLRGIIIFRPVSIPKWVILIVIPIGMFLLFTSLIRNVFDLVSKLKNYNMKQ